MTPNTVIWIIGISLSIIDLLFFHGIIIFPVVGFVAKGIQEHINEGFQMVIMTYFYMLTKGKK